MTDHVVDLAQTVYSSALQASPGDVVSVWMWFVIGYAVFVAVLIGYAAHIALSSASATRRRDGYKVLKLIWGTATGAGGVLAIGVRMYEMGLL